MLPDPLRVLPWAAGNNPAATAKTPNFGPYPRALRRPATAALMTLALLHGAACSDSPGPVPQAQPYTDPGMAEAGAYRMHYALTMTPDLASGIAGSYGIVQRRNLALLTIALAPRNPTGGLRTDPPEIEAESVSLTGERNTLALARHDEAGGPSWLATVEVRHRVPVTIDIRARATDSSPEIRVRLTREFRLE